MTFEEFINQKLCPAGVVTAWDGLVITTAFRLDDLDTLAAITVRLAMKAGVEVPDDLTLT